MTQNYYSDMVYGVDGPPNPVDLTEHTETQDGGNKTTVDSGGSYPAGIYGIMHLEAENHALQTVPDTFPDHLTDVGDEAARSGRPATKMVPPVREYPGQQIITQSYRVGPADAALPILSSDPDRKRARVTVYPESGALGIAPAGQVLAYLSSNGSSVFPGQSTGVVRMWSITPSSMDREVTAAEGLYLILDPTSVAVWVDVYVERYQ